MNREQAINHQYKHLPCLYKRRKVRILTLNYPYHKSQMAFIMFNDSRGTWVELSELKSIKLAPNRGLEANSQS